MRSALFREVVQGCRFAGPITAVDRAAITDGTENARGLDGARRRFSEIG